MNSFGRIFRISTFGEARGPVLGVLIDGIPPRLDLDLEQIQFQVDRCQGRAGDVPGTAAEGGADCVTAWSGLSDGLTTGAPLALVISNPGEVADEADAIKGVIRPGHGDYTWQKKYGLRESNGGGRASFRENLTRVVAGTVARQVLAGYGVTVLAHTKELGGVRALSYMPVEIARNPLCCADPDQVEAMAEAIQSAYQDGDTLGGLVEVRASGVPAGWGDPVFGSLDALLAGGFMSISGAGGVSMGDGFCLGRLQGSEANDPITPEGFETNHAGGILGGISNGEEVVARVGFRPAPSLLKPQATLDSEGNPVIFSVAKGHIPCTVPRLVPVVEAMTSIVLLDAFLAQRALIGSEEGENGTGES